MNIELKANNSSRMYMVFDVESLGLRGTPVSVGYIVFDLADQDPNIVCPDQLVASEANLFACSWEAMLPSVSSETAVWLRKNMPRLMVDCDDSSEVSRKFTEAWKRWQMFDTTLVCDVAWPVEAGFLLRCSDQWEMPGPYPLIDIAGMVLARGFDPLHDPILDIQEQPTFTKHNPLEDARWSAVKFIRLMNIPNPSVVTIPNENS